MLRTNHIIYSVLNSVVVMGLPLCSWQAERRGKGHCWCWHWLLCGEGKLMGKAMHDDISSYGIGRAWMVLRHFTRPRKNMSSKISRSFKKQSMESKAVWEVWLDWIGLDWMYGTMNGKKCSLSFLYIAIVNVMQDKVQQQQAAAAKS